MATSGATGCCWLAVLLCLSGVTLARGVGQRWRHFLCFGSPVPPGRSPQPHRPALPLGHVFVEVSRTRSMTRRRDDSRLRGCSRPFTWRDAGQPQSSCQKSRVVFIPHLIPQPDWGTSKKKNLRVTHSIFVISLRDRPHPASRFPQHPGKYLGGGRMRKHALTQENAPPLPLPVPPPDVGSRKPTDCVRVRTSGVHGSGVQGRRLRLAPTPHMPGVALMLRSLEAGKQACLSAACSESRPAAGAQ